MQEAAVNQLRSFKRTELPWVYIYLSIRSRPDFTARMPTQKSANRTTRNMFSTPVSYELRHIKRHRASSPAFCSLRTKLSTYPRHLSISMHGRARRDRKTGLLPPPSRADMWEGGARIHRVLSPHVRFRT